MSRKSQEITRVVGVAQALTHGSQRQLPQTFLQKNNRKRQTKTEARATLALSHQRQSKKERKNQTTEKERDIRIERKKTKKNPESENENVEGSASRLKKRGCQLPESPKNSPSSSNAFMFKISLEDKGF